MMKWLNFNPIRNNNIQIKFTIPTYYTILGFLEGKTPDQLLLEYVKYWTDTYPTEYYLKLDNKN